jgi:hypothetical protein
VAVFLELPVVDGSKGAAIPAKGICIMNLRLDHMGISDSMISMSVQQKKRKNA